MSQYTESDKKQSSAALVKQSSAVKTLKPDVSMWEAFGENNVLEKLLLNKQVLAVDDLVVILTEEINFCFKYLSLAERHSLDRYFRDVDDSIDFDVMDRCVKMCKYSDLTSSEYVNYQYGGYTNKDSDIFNKLGSCFSALESGVLKYAEEDSKLHLMKYFIYGMDFITEVTEMLQNPRVQCEKAFENLFSSFSRLAGLQLRDAAREAPHGVHIYGCPVSGRSGLRAYVPVDDDCWRQCPVKLDGNTHPKDRVMSAVVKVQVSAPEEGDETERHLGQIVEKCWLS